MLETFAECNWKASIKFHLLSDLSHTIRQLGNTDVTCTDYGEHSNRDAKLAHQFTSRHPRAHMAQVRHHLGKDGLAALKGLRALGHNKLPELCLDCASRNSLEQRRGVVCSFVKMAIPSAPLLRLICTNRP